MNIAHDDPLYRVQHKFNLVDITPNPPSFDAPLIWFSPHSQRRHLCPVDMDASVSIYISEALAGARTFYYRTTICTLENRTGTGQLRKCFARRPPKDLEHPTTPHFIVGPEA